MIQFPRFLFGSEETVIGLAESEGAAWLKSWRETGALPSHSLREIEEGDVVLVHHGSLDPFTPRWRLCGVEFALTRDTDEALLAAIRATPWGALSACARMQPPTTVEMVTRRGRALLDQWESLSKLRYIGRPKAMPKIVTFPGLNQDDISFDDLVKELFDGPLALWGPQLGSPRLRLEHALDAMANASFADVRDKLVDMMAKLAREHPRMKGTHVEDPHEIARCLDELPDDERAELIAGVYSALLGPLYDLLRAGRD
jgi:hypothetical protein